MLPLADQLATLTAGLLFLSESEAALTVIRLPKSAILPDALREAAHLAPDALAEELPLVEVLGPFATAPEGADEVARQDAARYQALLDFLTARLQRPVAYRLGTDAKKALFFIGRQPNRAWLGVQTEVVET